MRLRIAVLVGLILVAIAATWWALFAGGPALAPPAPPASTAAGTGGPPGTPLSARADGPAGPPPAAPVAERPPLPSGSAVVRGRVADRAGGAPVAGARVRLEIADPAALARAAAEGDRETFRAVDTVTAGDGTFEIRKLPAWTLAAIRVVKAGFEVFPDPLEGDPVISAQLDPRHPLDREIGLRRGGTIHGKVLSTDGRPAAGVKVFAFAWRDEFSDFDEDLRTSPVVTDAGGRYRIAGVWQGRVGLGVESPEWAMRPLVEPWDLDESRGKPSGPSIVDVPPGGDVEKDLTVHACGTVEGVVLDPDGKPAVGLTVRIVSHATTDGYREDDGAGGGTGGTVDRQGRFRVTGVVPGPKLAATVDGKRGKEGESGDFALAEGGHVRDLRIGMSPGVELFLQVKDSSGNPVSGAEVRLVDGASNLDITRPPFSKPGVWTAAQTTDGQGNARFDGLASTSWLPVVKVAGRTVTAGDQISTEGDTAPPEAVTSLPDAKRITGTVHLADGSPAAGAEGKAWPYDLGDPCPSDPFFVEKLRSDANGGFSLKADRYGQVRISWRSENGEVGTFLVSGDDGPIQMTLGAPVTVVGRVVAAGAGTPIAGIPVLISTIGYGKAASAATGEDGRFELEGIPPGRLMLVAGDTDDWQRRWLPDPPVDDPTLVVRLDPTISLSGTLLDPAGKPAGAVLLTFFCRAPGAPKPSYDESRSVTTRWDGTFHLDNLPTGTFTVTADLPEAANPVPLARDVAPGKGPVVLRLLAGKRITGRAVLAPEARREPPDEADPNEADGPADDSDPADETVDLGALDVEIFDRVTGEQVPANTWTAVQDQPDQPANVFRTDPVDPSHTYDITVWPSSGPFSEVLLAGSLLGVKPGTANLTVILRRLSGTISGELRDQSGSASPGEALVAVAIGVPSREAGARIVGESDSDGKFQLRVRPDLTYRIQTGGDGSDFAPAVSPPLTPGSTGVRIVLRPGAEISGRLLYPNGKAAIETNIRGVFDGGETTTGLAWFGDGSFRLTGLPPGPVHLYTAGDYDDQPVKDLGVVTAPAENVILTVKPDRR